MAPATQILVPPILWFGANFTDVDVAGLKARKMDAYSHDNLFHTLLGVMGVKTQVYDTKLDIVGS